MILYLTIIGKLGKKYIYYIGKLGKGEWTMTKEEILKAAQAESDGRGEYENAVGKRAVNVGTMLGVILCTILVLLEYFLTKSFDFGKVAIIFTMAGASNLYEGLQRKKKMKVIAGALESVIALFFIFLSIGVLLI